MTNGSVGTVAVAPRTRITSVDALRGFVMIIMALDHTREFFTNVAGNPLDPQHTTLALFFTRWITHVCAPVFVALAGTSIYLQRRRRPVGVLSRHLLTRGLWLIAAELTLVHLVFNFTWQWNVQLLEVIWAIGVSMIVMAALVRVPVRWIAMVGLLLVAGHNALDPVMVEGPGALAALWRVLHVPGLIAPGGMQPPMLIVAYPVLPWIGVMALGYAFGVMLDRAREARVTFELRAGVAMLAAFVALRWTNAYGDPVVWRHQAAWWRTVLSFLNVQKYPPSLLFLLATLGLALVFMALIERAEASGVFARARRVLETYGRVPFFYFLLHIAVIHLAALVTACATGSHWRWWITAFPNGGVLAGHPPGWGFGLPAVWLIWIGVVVFCYPACRWYARVRAQRQRVWLSYL